jgi:acetyl esterase/lipase
MIYEERFISVPGTAEQAKLTTYVLDNYDVIDSNRRRPAVIICPGGAYRMTSDREAEAVAIQLNAAGFQAFVLRYSVAPSRFPTALLQVAQTVALVRDNAELWHVNPNQIIVGGFSAGGHLACSLGTFWNQDFVTNALGKSSEEIRPNGMMLCYPVITSGEFAHQGSFENLLGSLSSDQMELVSLEKQITKEFPPAFIWHTVADEMVPVENSLLLAQSLQRCQVPFEMHLYPKGVHGLALANEETKDAQIPERVQEECTSWMPLFISWVKHLF